MIVSTALLMLILLPVFVSLLLSLPFVQNQLIDYASNYASEYLDTEVSIGHIDVTTTGGIEVKELFIRDLQGDSLIFATQLNTRLLAYHPFDKRLKLGQSKVNDALLNIQARGDGETNISQIVELIANKNTDSQKVEIRISGGEIQNMRVVIEQLKHREVEYGVDYGNIRVAQMAAKFNDVRIQGNDVTASIDKLSALEQSGFRLNDLNGELTVANGVVQLDDLNLSSRWSYMKLNRLRLSDENWLRYRNFITSTSIYVDIEDGFISSDDVAYFAPQLRSWGVQLEDVNLTAEGVVNDLRININDLSYGDDTRLSAYLELDGLPYVDTTQMMINIARMTSRADDINSLSYSLTGKELPSESYKILEAAEGLTIIGDLRGGLGSVAANVQIESAMGSVASDIDIEWPHLATAADVVAINGWVTADNLQLQRITKPSDELGEVSMRADISGVIDRKTGGEMIVMSSVKSIEWRKYRYQNIDIAGRFNAESLRATVGCNDPNLMFGLTAAIEDVEILDNDGDSEEFLNANSSSNISLNLMYADLKALGLSKDDSESTLAADLTISSRGDNAERSAGEIIIRHLKYTHNQDQVESDSLSLKFMSMEGNRSIVLESDFASATFESRDSVANIIEYLNNAMMSYLPSLYKRDVEVNYPTFSSAMAMNSAPQRPQQSPLQSLQQQSQRPKAIGRRSQNISTLEVQIKEMKPLLAIMDSDLHINEGSSLRLEFDVQNQLFNGAFRSDYIERKSLMAIDVAVDLYNTEDSVVLSSRAKDLFVSTLSMNNAELNAVAQDDRIAITSGFSNDEDSSLAEISADMAISRRIVGNQSIQELELELHPSIIHDQEQEWNLSANAISIKYAGVKVDQFVVSNADQHMLVDGLASSSTADTINMTMRNFDLSVLTTFIADLGYQIDGVTNGHINVASALNNASVEASISLDSVSVNTIPAPPMALEAIWESQMNRARLTLTNRNNNDRLLRGYYIPTEVSYYANLQADKVDMELIDPPLKGVTEDTEGVATIDLTIQGSRRNATIEGDITMRDGATTIAYTQAKYYIPEARFTVKNNVISGADIAVNDGQNGSARLGINVDMKNLSNIEYSMSIAPRNLLVLNTTERDNDVFYGTLYASGVASISGDKNGTKMNIAATSDDNSHFFMQLLSKSTISSADFITFVEPENTQVLDAATLRRMQYRIDRERAASNAIEIDMSLDVRQNTEVQLVIDPTVGDIIKSRGEGRFNLKINPKQNVFEMYGDYTISEGSYLFTLSNIINKRFVIEPNSTIQWNGSPTDAMLNIDAVYQLKTSLQPLISSESTRTVPVNCVINLSNMLTRPDVAFSIDFPSLDSEQQAVVSTTLNDQEVISRQFFYLMLANTFMPETSSVDSDFGVSTTASTGFELLTNQLSNWLSTSNYDIIIRYRPESELTGDEVDIGFSRSLINDRLLLEVEGNYVSNSAEMLTENGSNFMGEAYLTWLIDKSGALQLRGFTQTIDRFNENQGLQETGIGVTYREEFEDLADLKAKVKARFSASPERQQRREERKEAKEEAKAEKAEKAETKEDEE